MIKKNLKLKKERKYLKKSTFLMMFICSIILCGSPEAAEVPSEIPGSTPDSLTQLHSIDSHDVTVEENLTDSYGDTYSDVLLFNADVSARAVYSLNGQYKRMTATMVSGEKTVSGQELIVGIFADSEPVYSITDYTSQLGPQTIDIDLTGVQELEIQTRQAVLSSVLNPAWIALTNISMEKNDGNAGETKNYERLLDNAVVDSQKMESLERMVVDSYGNIHNGGIRFSEAAIGQDLQGYFLINLNQKYTQLTGEIVTDSGTPSDAVMNAEIYLDDVLAFEQTDITKTVESVPFVLDVQGVKVVKFVISGYEDINAYIVDDKLLF